MTTATPTRLSKAARRSQLLDVAADLVLARGVGAVTMERLAARAGVSKALVYLHFDNADSVLSHLFHREVTHLGAEMLAAVDRAAEPEARLRLAVHTYFDIVERRGALFTVLSKGSTAPAHVRDDHRVGPRFVADLFRRIFDVSPRRAKIASAMFVGAVAGGLDAWFAGEVSRRDVEEAAVSVALGLLRED